MLGEAKEGLRTILADKELFELQARVAKKNFDALRKAGFTKKEAIEIVARQGTIVSLSKKS